MPKVHQLPPKPGSRSAKPPPPSHLGAPERRLWIEITARHQFDDAASLAVLATTLAAHQRARRCREAIDRDGEVSLDRFGQAKAHPLLTAETHARAGFLAGMKALRLDLADEVGR